ncbi:MAG: adenylyl-sulfate kinase [Coxiellaceae bacterium]|nr:adenylyl-sulfate kinase [Coxiellaceae bacterium]
MKNFIPTLFWITGLSGAGKTTIGELLTHKLRDRAHPVVFLDGDVLRDIYDNRFGHDRASRLEASFHYARLCRMLVAQNVHVVCATISLFHETQNWNRQNIKNYMEILVDVPMSELIKRDSKAIYSRALSGDLCNIVGVDITPELPKNSEIKITNENTVDESVNFILEKYDTRIYLKEKNNANNMELHEIS